MTFNNHCSISKKLFECGGFADCVYDELDFTRLLCGGEVVCGVDPLEGTCRLHDRVFVEGLFHGVISSRHAGKLIVGRR